MKLPSHRRLIIPPLSAFACAATSLPAAPILIDGFSDGLAPTTTSAFVDGSMLGGECDLDFGSIGTFEISGGVGELSGNSTGSGALSIIYDGDDDDPDTHAFALPDVDLTDGGSNNRFEIRLASVTGSIDVTVWVYEPGGDGKFLDIEGVTEPGLLVFPFADFLVDGAGTDLSAAKAVGIDVSVDLGEGFEIDSFLVTGPEVPPADTTKPALTFLKKKKLKNPRHRHRIVGKATDNAAVAAVEVKSRLQRGWKKARLRANGRFQFRTKRLKSGRNIHKFRATDTSGNRSRVKKVKPLGVSGLDLGSGR